MKKILILIAVIAMNSLAAQTIITVRENITMEAVAQATLTAQLPAPNIRIAGATTNEKGQADISSFADADSLYVRHPNYGTQGFTMENVKKSNYQIFLVQKQMLMSEFVYSANKTEEDRSDVPYQIEVIDNKDVAFSNPQTSADMLQNSGSVFVQRSQMGGGSPVIRGFEANKVLMVVDGVRMNNAIYRAGHLQDVMTVDPNILDRTEVIFGPSSTIYGSDALGGTMHFYTRKPVLSSEEKMFVTGNVMLRTSSANNEFSGHIDFNLGGTKWASLTSITNGNFGDLRMGANADPAYYGFGWANYYVVRENNQDSVYRNPDPLVQKFTAYSQIDITQKLLFKYNEKTSHLINLQYSNTSNIPRYDRLAQIGNDGRPRFAEWSYGPQQRILASYSLVLDSGKTVYDRTSVILAFQKIDQDRITRRLDNVNRISQNEDVMVFSVNVDMNKVIREKHELRYGMELTHNIVNSAATRTDITTGTASDDITRYPDGGSTMSTAALYFSHTWEINDKWILADGIRLSMVKLHSDWSDTTFYPFPFKSIDQTNFAPSGNLGLVWKPCPSFNAHVTLASGFRAPNVDDVSKVFESLSGTLIVPNPNLKPEMIYSAEIGFDLQISEGVHWVTTGFYSKMTNAIVAANFTLNGEDSVLFDGNMSRVIASQNMNSAYITGITNGFYANFNDHWSLRGTVTYTYGRYEDALNDTVVPLDHIPPVFGQTGLIYHRKGLETELFTRYNGWKHLADYSPSGEDNLNQATADGSPAWVTLNFRASYSFNSYFSATLACENIMDQNYRNFASGISAPGRNFIISLRGHF
jgi:hemoglobin/transferrin/lactoferrin receptor protein